jgi:hypothetical protein
MAGAASAQTITNPLPAATQLVATSTAAPPVQQSFTISSPQNLVVTLTDLKLPAALQAAGVVVTQSGLVVGSAQLAAPATTATISLPSASGNYTMYVFGVPSATLNFGTFTACVAPSNNPSNCIQDASLSGNITVQTSPQNSTVSTIDLTLNVTTQGAYTFNFADLQFPVALATQPSLALFQGATTVQTGITSGAVITLNPGTYTLLGIAQADPTAMAGLYGLTITDPTGATFMSAAEPVGQLPPATQFSNPAQQSVTLTVTDYAFPAALASASAILTQGGTVVGTANSAGGPVSVNAPFGSLQVWSYGSPGASVGTFSVDVSAGTTDLFTTAQGVGPSGTTYAYAYVVPITTAGSYEAIAGDLQFPSQLGGLGFAVAQNGKILQQSATATTLKFTAVAGNLVLLADAQAPTSGGTTTYGLFDINVQSATGTPAGLVFDKTQDVNSATGSLFQSQAVVLSSNASYDATLTDLKFPQAFASLGLVVSQGANVLGKIFGGGTFSFNGSPGTYQLTFVATPGTPTATATDPNPIALPFGLYAASVDYSAPTVTLTSNVSSAATGTTIDLTWTSTNASSCTATGGNFTGSQQTSGTNVPIVLSATTTYTLTCTGTGGTASQSVTVTATTPPSSGHGGGGSIDWAWLAVGCALLTARVRRRR